jgi:hypothetical protein
MQDSDNGFIDCNCTKAKKHIKELCESNNVAHLQELNYHSIPNAFNKLDFGAENPYGINHATMSANLHTPVQKGWYLYAFQAIFGGLTHSMKGFHFWCLLWNTSPSSATTRRATGMFHACSLPMALSTTKTCMHMKQQG